MLPGAPLRVIPGTAWNILLHSEVRQRGDERYLFQSLATGVLPHIDKLYAGNGG